MEPSEIERSPTSFGKEEWAEIHKGMAFIIFLLHLLSIFAPFQFSWSALWVAVALHVITGLFGMNLSYHRNLSHKSFKLPNWLEYLFAYCGVQALEVN